MRSLRDLSSLKGSVALVTGAGGHIGSAVADGLAELGADLILLDRDSASIGSVADAIHKKYEVHVAELQVDLEYLGDVDILSEVRGFAPVLDVLVNCAAFVGTDKLEGWNEPFEGQSVATWRRALEVNLTAPFQLVQSLLPLLSKSSGASVVNFLSIYGICAPDYAIYEGLDMNNPAAYAASKAGLLQLTRWLATTLAPKIRVNAITPGGVERGQPDSFIERYTAKTPLRRMAREEDMKGAVAYLASNLSRYVTGQNIVIDGGWSVW